MKRYLYIITVFIICIPSLPLQAQFVVDALRPAAPPNFLSARSAGMGNAFIGVADDYSALYWNPAGLGQLRFTELSLGLGNNKVTNSVDFLGSTTSTNNSATSLNSLGFAIPFPVERGSLVFGIGYNRLVDFTGSLGFEGYNSQSSILPSLYAADTRYDLPWNLGLEDTLGIVAIKNNVHQKGQVFESGGLNQWAFGGSIEAMRNLWLGVSFNILTGSYSWQRTFEETDPNNLHGSVIPGKDIDRQGFQRVTIDESLMQDYSGWNVKFGFLYTVNDKARFGITIKTPSLVAINEDYSLNGVAVFSNVSENANVTYAPNDYNITTAWVFGIGASFSPVSFLTIAGDIDLTDNSEIQFDNQGDFQELNRNIKQQLQSTNNYRLGVEVNVPGTGLSLRGGFGQTFSPYNQNVAPYKNFPTYDKSTSISAGIGYLFENTLQINAAFVSSSYKTWHFNYSADASVPDSALQTLEDISNQSLLFSLAYRF
jgi:hypothetical protein